MIKKQSYSLLTLFLVMLVALTIYLNVAYVSEPHNEKEVVNPEATNTVAASSTRPLTSSTYRAVTTTASKTTLETAKITLRAGTQYYTAVVPHNSSVYDVMAQLSSTTSFTFKATYHSGLGFFIESINNIKNAHGTYWTLYINGTNSTVGASQYRLKNNDEIEWKYEKK